ncbi:MAG: type II toxin-antitoxin system RelB/DinJ family antitoxin [Roseburia sp.]|nr:type II toxin-antitoxin system RelB/DinJ family antitoxin [Roseburia sp.]
MANKSANVSVRVQPEIKEQAEAVLAQLGLPVSVLIDTLYRQIIYTGGIPYSLSVPKLKTRDDISTTEFDAMMEKGYAQAVNGQAVDLDTAFDALHKGIKYGV